MADFIYPAVCADCENKRNGKKKCFWGNATIERAKSWGGDGICFHKAMNEDGCRKACEILAANGIK